MNPRKSMSDIQYQLKTYAMLLEQYQYHIEEIPSKYSPQTFQIFKNSIMESQNYLEGFFQQNNEYKQILGSILGHNIDTINQAAREFAQIKTRLSNLLESLEDKEICMEDFRNKLQKSENQIASLSLDLQGLRQENASLHQKIDQKQIQMESDRNQIRRTFLTVQQQNEHDKQMVQQLYDNQENLQQQISQLKNDKQFHQKRQSQLEQELKKANRKILELENENNILNNQIQNLKITVQDQYNVPYSYRKSSAQNSQDNDQFTRGLSFVEHVNNSAKNKLSEDVDNYRIPNQKQVIASYRHYNRRSQDDQSDVMSINQENQDIVENRKSKIKQEKYEKIERPPFFQKGKKNLVQDPYYSHYILISQSIKIKEDCQDMLNIDMKPYYKEVIEKRIPMHLWDEWIRNRLRELNKRKL